MIQFHTFFISVYTPDTKWNDLDATASIWRLQLHSADRSVAATEIERIKVDENLRKVYRHIDRFDRAYLVRFPISSPVDGPIIRPDSKSFRLRIASAIGTTQLEWQLTQHRAPSAEAPTTTPHH